MIIVLRRARQCVVFAVFLDQSWVFLYLCVYMYVCVFVCVCVYVLMLVYVCARVCILMLVFVYWFAPFICLFVKLLCLCICFSLSYSVCVFDDYI